MKRSHVIYAIYGMFAHLLMVGGLQAVCPSGCTSITSGPVTFCRCMIYETSNPNDRVMLVTDKPITIVDVDGDGLRDIPFGIYYYGSEGAYILRQVSGGIPGTFTAVGISSPPLSTYGMVDLGDINGDGKVDFAIAQQERGHSVYILRSSGTSYDALLVYSNTSFRPNSITGYYDGSNAHLYWTAYGGHVFYYNGSTVIEYPTDPSLRPCADGITYGDFNGDGWDDVACANYRYNTYGYDYGLHVFFYDPSLGFYSHISFATGRKWQGIVSYDFDGDGDLDIAAVGNDISVFYNDGTGTGWTENLILTYFSTGANPFARINVGDMDCDGDMDLVVATAVPNTAYSNTVLAWIENTSSGWNFYPIDAGGNSDDTYRPYPYGVRVGYLDEPTSAMYGGLDIVIIKEQSNQFWAYYDTLRCPLGYDDGEDVSETRIVSQVRVEGLKGGIMITSSGKAAVTIYDVSGKNLVQKTVNGKTFVKLNPGVYIVENNRRIRRVVVR